ncbi:GGDEF domain-containing protein [Ewingella americana]|uniref:GGDEF domain-containing protein n=1 Tax=Ewingella americana TaxID=41202 RepID=UPI001639C209|nr:GGDEF domain-containing protein [Ewingella americana]QMV53010.1 GGDEF domain-containing protein [Ewingella americana]
MIFHAYDELLKSKHRLSLLLFFFLNSASALFSMINPAVKMAKSTLPLIIIGVVCVSGLIFIYLNKKTELFRLSICSIVVGSLWAWHIILQFDKFGDYDKSYLLVSLLSIFFISVIALSDNFLAFCLHVAPSTGTVIYLDGFTHISKILFTVALPLIGLYLQHMMLKRSDAFTRRMLINLYSERQKFSDLSMIDPLTGLYNRRGLQNKLETVFSQDKSSHYVMLLDIDHFKAYNDNYGHSMGDQALVRVSAAIRDAVRSRDVVVRYGGEEFLVVMSNVTQDYAMRMAERIQNKVLSLNIPHSFNADVSTHVTVSAGLSTLHDGDFPSALTAADQLLYHAKNSGRNKILYSWGTISDGEKTHIAL